MKTALWHRLHASVECLKNTEYRDTHSSLFDRTQIVLTSEFGRYNHDNVYGSLDPSYDPLTGTLKQEQNKHPESFIPNYGDVYSTALLLSGIGQKNRGRNERPALPFIVLKSEGELLLKC